MDMIESIVVRHRKENKKKCSLQPLVGREGFLFLEYPKTSLPSRKGSFLLSFEGPLLSREDREKTLVLLDGTWRYAMKMHRVLKDSLPQETRSLPCEIVTAYPRRQVDCEDPKRGLASIEALAVAYHLMGY